jgi:hypothetical protein
MTDTEYAAALHYYRHIARVAESVSLSKDDRLGQDLILILLGVGSRETAWGTSRFLDQRGPGGRGDHGHGHGLMQIDDRSHGLYINSGMWADAASNIAYGASVLLQSYAYLRRKDVVDPVLTRAALAGYNAGPGRVLQAISKGRDCDDITTGRDYGRDVLRRAEWYGARLAKDFPSIPLAKLDPLAPDRLAA